VDVLSGGERARVMLARVLVAGTPVILADEPVAALDPRHQLAVMRLLAEEARGSGRVVGIVLHDLTLAARFCDALVLMEGGRVVEAGEARAVLASPALARVYGVAFGHALVGGAPVVTPLDADR
jgi:iron complex transport system ATP-binding protein